jgi:hypothetical protein
LGTDPAQLSRYLSGSRITSLTNYLRIIRALGYRFKAVFEKVDAGRADPTSLSDLRVLAHKVHHNG